MSYDEKLKYCMRPENLEDTSLLDWEVINEHLNTNAHNLPELIQELGQKRFGCIPTVGDCFCGGGSIPFETARLGLNVYASDLNPIAVLLTWAALNILSSNEEEMKEIREFQEKVYRLADQQITEWGIEHNENGGRAISYLYCHETLCPECGYKVPLAPSWVIGRGTKTVAQLILDSNNKRFKVKIESGVSKKEMEEANNLGTVKNDHLHCPACNQTAPISAIRGDRRDSEGNIAHGLRRWEADEFLPRPDDVFQERLYCIRYEEEYMDKNEKIKSFRHYVAPTVEDLKREEKVEQLLRERFSDWQRNGYIPNIIIEEGYNTSQVIRERGWSYWHQLFNPRQLLVNGYLSLLVNEYAKTKKEKVIGLLGITKCCDFNSKLSLWSSVSSKELVDTSFYNQALNTLLNFGSRSLHQLYKSWFYSIKNNYFHNNNTVLPLDARKIKDKIHFWLTDPPYADSVNYHELSEFFLAWDKKMLMEVFPNWYIDSKRALAVKGKGYSFNNSMIEIYKNLAKHMPGNGMQIVMFTHQDVSVWAELVLILWSAGLRVTAAWNIATETDSGGLKDGNYIKGTVLLVLRKQTSEETAFDDELYPEIEEEVKRQIESMRDLDDKEDPNFSDTDYLLAAYASSMKVLTSYKKIEGINIQYELSKERKKDYTSPIESLIHSSVKIAYDYLIPSDFNKISWKMLSPSERFFIKGLEIETHGNTQLGSYQELARGFGVNEYQDMLAYKKANKARLKTASEYKMRGMQSEESKTSVLRNTLAAIYQGFKEEAPAAGKNWLHHELVDYWSKRSLIIEILEYLSRFEYHDEMPHWKEDARYARMIRDLVKSDGI